MGRGVQYQGHLGVTVRGARLDRVFSRTFKLSFSIVAEFELRTFHECPTSPDSWACKQPDVAGRGSIVTRNILVYPKAFRKFTEVFLLYMTVTVASQLSEVCPRMIRACDPLRVLQ